MHVSSPPTTSRIKSNPIKNCKIQKLTFETREPGLLIHSISSFISPPELNDVLIARVQPHPPPHTHSTLLCRADSRASPPTLISGRLFRKIFRHQWFGIDISHTHTRTFLRIKFPFSLLLEVGISAKPEWRVHHIDAMEHEFKCSLSGC